MIQELLNRRLARIAFLLVGGYLIFQTSRNLLTLWSAKGRIQEAENRLRQLQQQNQALQEKKREVSEPGYIEREARDKLGYVKEGEVILVLPQDEVEKLARDLKEEVLQPETYPEELPNWQKWWKFFTD